MKYNIINLVNTLNSIIPHYNFYLFDENVSIENFVSRLKNLNPTDNCIVIYSNSYANIKQNYNLKFLLDSKIKLLTISNLKNSIKIGPFIKTYKTLILIQSFKELNSYKKEPIDCSYSNNDSINIMCNLIMLLINSTTNTNNVFVLNHLKNNIEVEKYTPAQQILP